MKIFLNFVMTLMFFMSIHLVAGNVDVAVTPGIETHIYDEETGKMEEFDDGYNCLVVILRNGGTRVYGPDCK